jgi:hypothetical protein
MIKLQERDSVCSIQFMQGTLVAFFLSCGAYITASAFRLGILHIEGRG